MWEKKKVKEPPNMRKNYHMWFGATQCENEIVKCEKKVREPPNVTNELLYVMLESHNIRMKPSNVRKKI